MRIYVVADEADRDGGFVVERLVQLGGEVVWLDRDDLPVFVDLEDPSMLLLLGSARGAHEPASADPVVRESALARASLRAGVPVMAICYGAQLLARALGGTSYEADDPELGWLRVDTIDSVLCPEGPWAQLHTDVFTPPPNAQVLGNSWYGPQCFVDDSLGARSIAWQFHPEVTTETYHRWIDEDEGMIRAAGQDPDELRRQALANAARSRNSAHRLTDDALEYLGVDIASAV
ncbi:MAG: type 1 glutamine amidotransferase [Aeromicrobium sp.]